MKTFKAIFTKEPVQLREQINYREYTFNASNNDEENVELGHFFFSKAYNKHLQIVFVFHVPFRYVNVKTGELSNDEYPFPYVKIKELEVPNANKADDTTPTED